MLVIEQDGAACELNQQGIKSRPFDHGILVPQEYAVWDFHEWLRDRGHAATRGNPTPHTLAEQVSRGRKVWI